MWGQQGAAPCAKRLSKASPVGCTSMHVPVGVVAPAGAGAPPGRIAAPGAAPQRPQVCAHQPARAIQSALHWPQLFFWAHVLPSAGWQAEANDASVHVYALPHTYAMPKAWQRSRPGNRKVCGREARHHRLAACRSRAQRRWRRSRLGQGRVRQAARCCLAGRPGCRLAAGIKTACCE